MIHKKNKRGVKHLMVTAAITPEYKTLVDMLAASMKKTSGTLWFEAMEKVYGKELRALQAKIFKDDGTETYQMERE